MPASDPMDSALAPTFAVKPAQVPVANKWSYLWMALMP